MRRPGAPSYLGMTASCGLPMAAGLAFDERHPGASRRHPRSSESTRETNASVPARAPSYDGPASHARLHFTHGCIDDTVSRTKHRLMHCIQALQSRIPVIQSIQGVSIMKKILVSLAVAVSALAAPALSFAQSNGPLTRAEVRADLVRVEQAGYNPAVASDPHYPDDIQAAEAKIAAEETSGGF